MKIDKIEIDGFGKLNNFSMTLGDGFNLVLGENESGKSTLCAFLLSMFYEMSNDGKRKGLNESIRRKYKPWNSEHFGGRVYFSHEGKKYILEKTFGSNKRLDKARLLDGESWDECGSAENVGERFFGLAKEGFLKTLYITGLGVDAKETGNEEILTRFSNMETSGDEDISYVNIKNALEKEQFAILSKTGKGGKLPTLRENKRQLEVEKNLAMRFYETTKQDERRVSDLKMQITDKQAELALNEKMYQTASEHEAYLAQKKSNETRKILCDALEDKCKKRDKLKGEIGRLSEDLIHVGHNDVDKAKILEKQLIITENKKEETKNEQQKLSELCSNTNVKQKKTATIVSAVVFIMFFIAGVLLKAIINPIMLLVAGIVISVAVFFAITHKNKENEEKLKEYELLSESVHRQLSDVKTEIRVLCDKYNVEDLNDFFAKAAKENEKLSREKELDDEITSLTSDIETLTKKIENLAPHEEKVFSDEVINYNGISASEFSVHINRIKSQLEMLNSEYYDLSLNLAKQSSGNRNISDIESDISVISSQIEMLEKRHNALEKASEWIMHAHGEIKQNYAPRLNKKTAEVFSQLTFNKYDSVKLGDGFHLNYKNESNQIVDSDFLSCGTYDLLYIALRFASIEVLFNDKIPPVILDDALLQLDDNRLVKAIEYMQSDNLGQVIYFTCHKTNACLFDNKYVNKLEL